MTTQPDALRIADMLDKSVLQLHADAAAELRRLHALNAEVVAELENCVDVLAMCFPDAPVDSCIGSAIKNGNAAIAKATGEQA